MCSGMDVCPTPSPLQAQASCLPGDAAVSCCGHPWSSLLHPTRALGPHPCGLLDYAWQSIPQLQPIPMARPLDPLPWFTHL